MNVLRFSRVASVHHYIYGDKHSPELISQFGSSAQKGLDLAASLVELGYQP